MPAAAVIPAPIAYIKVAAVKKLVVGFLVRCPWVADPPSGGESVFPRPGSPLGADKRGVGGRGGGV